MSPTNRNCGTLIGRAAAAMITALLCTATFNATGVIAAESPSDAIEISYVKADLSQPESAQLLYKRIQLAARSVCHEPSVRELARYRIYKRCFDEAVDAAVAKVDASTLTALHRSKMQRSATG